MKKWKRGLAVAALAIAAAGMGSSALAQFQKPGKAVEYRQGAFTIMGHHFGRIGAMVNGKAPFDAKLAAQDADVVAMVSQLPWAGFGPETKALKSHAKPEMWAEPGSAKFKDLSKQLMENTAALQKAAQTGDLDKIKLAFGNTGKTCKACHDSFVNKS